MSERATSLLPFPHLPARVGPGSKLEVALLVVKGEPGDVNLARRLEKAGGDVEATAVTAHDHIRLVSPVELLVRAVQIRLLKCEGKQNYMDIMDTVWIPPVVRT